MFAGYPCIGKRRNQKECFRDKILGVCSRAVAILWEFRDKLWQKHRQNQRNSVHNYLKRLRHTIECVYTVEPPIMDTPKSGQPPYNGQTAHPLPIYCPYISTSEQGTTSEQWTKCLSPMCPLFGGSTVYI